MMFPSYRIALSCLSVAAILSGCAQHPDAPYPTDPTTRRTTTQGEVQGYRTPNGALGWLGIPYAAAPVGERRWRAPEPMPAWQGVREATQTGSACLQMGSWLGGAPDASINKLYGAEDCLFLNIWTPETLPAAGLPVMVWIHGGGNTSGHGGFYDFSEMAERFNLVMISFNYRLGSLGWFHHNALWNENDNAEDRSGNFGLLDQIALLRWVRTNIKAFGGNPDQVTIFGESAGGLNTFALLVSPLSKGLFRGAIAQSGYTTSFSPQEASIVYPTRTDNNAGTSNDMLVYWLEAEGKAPDRKAAIEYARGMSDPEIAAFLRARQPRQLIEDYSQNRNRLPIMIEDGTVLPTAGIAGALAAGQFHQVPLIAGTNRDENNLWLALTPELVNNHLGIFYRPKDEDRYRFFAKYRALGWKSRGADDPNRWVTSAGGTSFAYRWDWDEEPNNVFGDFSLLVGAAHGLETTFLTGDFPVEGLAGLLFTDENRDGRLTLSREMQSYWAEFAYSGSPNRGRDGKLPEWSAWDPAQGASKLMILDTPAGGGLRMSSLEVTKQEVLTEAASHVDTRGLEDVCWVVYLNLKDEPDYKPAQYLDWQEGRCRQYPPAHFDAKNT